MGNFVNPIIQAMFASGQAKVDARKQTEVERANKEDEQARRDQLKQQNDIQQRAFDLQQKQFDLERTQADFKALIDQIGIGATPKTTRATSPTGNPRLGDEMLVGPLGGNLFDPSTIATAEQRRNTKVGDVKATTQAQLEVQEPFDMRADARKNAAQLESEARDTKRRENEIKLNQEFDSRMKGLDRIHQLALEDKREQGANYRANLAARARLSAPDYNEDAIEAYINDVYITGNTTESQVPTKLRSVLKGTVPKGWTPLTKKDQEEIEGLGLVDKLIGDVALLAQQGQGTMGRLGAFTGIGMISDAGDTKRRVDGLIGNLSRIFGGEKGVLSTPDIERMKKLAYSVTSNNNAENAKNLQEFLSEKLGPVLGKYNSDQLDQILGVRGLQIDRFAPPDKEDPNTQIELDNGQRVPNTRANRKKYGLE